MYIRTGLDLFLSLSYPKKINLFFGLLVRRTNAPAERPVHVLFLSSIEAKEEEELF